MASTLSTNSSFELQIRWLQLLQGDIKTFGPNQINMIKEYLPYTGVHTKMIAVFEQMRRPLMTSTSDTLLDKNYDAALQDFHTHIGKRIVCLTNLDRNNSRFKLGKRNLLETSFYIQDHLTDIELVVKYAIKEGSAIIDSEIKELIQILPGYFFKIDRNANGKLRSVIQKLKKLEKFISRNDFNKGHTTFLEIEEEIRLHLTPEIACEKGRVTKLFSWISKLRVGCC